jgi:DNA-binding IclR family transcriptional regulator
MKDEKHTVYSIQTVCKAFELLEYIAESPTALTLAELSKKIELSRNKTYRLLSTLCEKGLLDPFAGKYQLGVSAVVLGKRFLMNSNVVTCAHPIMEELARKHDEAVYMTVLNGDEVLFLDMVDCDQQIKASPLVGRRFPLFSNAAGKVMKALDSRDILEKIFKAAGRKKVDSGEMEKLVTELNEIRAKGVAVECGGLGEGVISVAVAVRDYAGKVVGAITMLGPSFRMLASRLESEIIPSMMEGGELLSQKFGYARG